LSITFCHRKLQDKNANQLMARAIKMDYAQPHRVAPTSHS
jgi:hypothetical protein